MNWTQENDGTLRAGAYAVLKLHFEGDNSYVPCRLTERGWELFRGLGFDSAKEAKAAISQAELESA